MLKIEEPSEGYHSYEESTMSFYPSAEVEGITMQSLVGRGTTSYTYHEIREMDSSSQMFHRQWLEELREWPELMQVAERLLNRAELPSGYELEWLRELSSVTGWELDDVAEDLGRVDLDPSERAERYRRLFDKYYSSATDHHSSGDLEQAGEKLYAAVLALVKYHAALRGVPIAHWSRGRVDSYIENNVKGDLRKTLSDLIDKVQRLHEYFYEGCPDEPTCRSKWRGAIELLEQARRKIFEEHT